MDDALNIFDGPLATCSRDPLTGYSRNGDCETGSFDPGVHSVCTQVTAEFLDFSRRQGNDLVTPAPQHSFPGLRPGDRWCLCAARWQEALEAGCAPPVVLRATHRRTLEIVALEDLKVHALDLS